MVVELVSVLVGLVVGLFFVEMGVWVIKIENLVMQGDVIRVWKVFIEFVEKIDLVYYCSVNNGKEVYFLDLKDFVDKEVVYVII